MKKEDFLNKLRQATPIDFKMPAGEVEGIQYENTLQKFIETSEAVGAKVIADAPEGSDLNDLARLAYPEAKVFASHLPEIDF